MFYANELGFQSGSELVKEMIMEIEFEFINRPQNNNITIDSNSNFRFKDLKEFDVKQEKLLLLLFSNIFKLKLIRKNEINILYMISIPLKYFIFKKAVLFFLQKRIKIII